MTAGPPVPRGSTRPDRADRPNRPVIALSIGDPCGIGPEIALRLLAEAGAGGTPALPVRVLVLGDRRVLERAAPLVPGAPRLETVDGVLLIGEHRPARPRSWP